MIQFMNKQDQIHHQLSKQEQKQQNLYHKFNILTKTNFKQEAQLSQWRTSSYPSIPRKPLPFRNIQPKSKKQQQQSILSESQAVISTHQLSHRYTFLNNHVTNDKFDKKQFKKNKPYILSLALPRRQELPSIYNDMTRNSESNKKPYHFKMHSPKYSGTPYNFLRHADSVKAKNRQTDLSEFPNKIYWNLKETTEDMSQRGKGHLIGKMRKAKTKSHNEGNQRALDKRTVVELKKCLIFGKQD